MDNFISSKKLITQKQRYYGRFHQTPITNIFDEFSGIKRFIEKLRTKEWVGFAILHPEIYGAMIIQNAKILKSSDIHIYETKNKYLSDLQSISFSPKVKISDNLLHSVIHFNKKNYSLKYDFSATRVKISVDVKGNKKHQPIKGEIILDVTKQSHPLVVSAKLPPIGTMYTNKIIYPASGYLQIADRKYEFLPERDLLILDEHKSHLPYKSYWLWGTFALPSENNFAGGNFAFRPQFDEQEEESAIWTPEGVEPLKNITFKKQANSSLSPWHIYSADGRLDVTFTPLGQKDVKQNLLFFSIDYYQMFGTYSGILKGKNKTWSFHDIHGYCEEMKMKS